MTFFSRKSPRIPQYDYATENYYFITICTHNKACIFGKPSNLNYLGKVAEKQILQISQHFSQVRIDKYVVMPNHIHMILILSGTKSHNLSQIVGLYKSGVTRQIHRAGSDIVVWQRSFHDRVIRNQQEYEKFWLYIHGNPGKWDEDCYNCEDV